MSDELTRSSLEPPGPVGRLVRLGLGTVLLYGTWNLLRFGPSEIGRQLVNPVEWLIHMGIALWLLPAVVGIGWNRPPGRRIRPEVLGGVGVLILISRLIDGVWWGPVVGWPVLVATIYTFAHSGISFVVSAVLASPRHKATGRPVHPTRVSGTDQGCRPLGSQGCHTPGAVGRHIGD